jgi:hypothetical protein
MRFTKNTRHFHMRWPERQLRADADAAFSLNADGAVERHWMLPASPDVDSSYDFQDLRLVRAVGKALRPTASLSTRVRNYGNVFASPFQGSLVTPPTPRAHALG